MKIFLTIIIFSFLFISSISAQKIKFGIVAGPASTTSNKKSLSSVSTDPTMNYTVKIKSNFSFFGGIVASIPLSKTIVFRPQLEYIAKGWTNAVDFTNSTDEKYNQKLTSHWIELPLNFVFTVPSKNGRFLFGLGPYIAYAMSAKLTDDREGYPDKTIEFTKSAVGDNVLSANRLDIGANLIASYEFRQGFFINLNYSHGFIDFRNDLDPNKFGTSNKNIVVGLGLGYMFK